MRWRILSVIGVLYGVQFIPTIFGFMALPIILRQEGHSATTIGLLQLAGMPYVLKFLWSPLIDRFRIGRDRYKSWIYGLSAIHVAALAALAFLDPAGAVFPLFLAFFIAIAAVSTQDVAVDALAISLMRPDERAMGATFQNMGMYLGAIVGGFGFLWIYGQIGWTAALLIQAAIFAAPLLALLLVSEPPRPADAPAPGFRSAIRFFAMPGVAAWLAIIASIRLPLVLSTLPIRLMMVDQGMSAEEIALWFGLIAMCGAGGSAAVFGPLIRKLPRMRALALMGVVNIALLAAVWMAVAALPGTVRFAIVAAWIAIAATDVVIYSGAMDKVRPGVSGFDFSVQVAICTLLPIMANPIVGVLYDALGGLAVIAISCGLAVIPLALLRLLFPAPGRAGAAPDTGTLP